MVLASDLHLLSGSVDMANERYKNNCLKFEILHFQQNDARIYLANEGYRITEIKTNASKFSLDRFDPAYPVLRFQGKNKITRIRIEYQK